jgi:MFS family permease
MKNHFLSRFDARNLRKTIIYFAIAIVLITISIVGEYINDRGDLNGLMILIFIIGFVLFFYAMLHPWGKVSFYFILIVIFIVLFSLLLSVGIGILTKMELGKNLGEAIGLSIIFVCVAAVIAGIIGIFTFAKGWQLLPYMGAVLSLLAVPIWLIACFFRYENLKTFLIPSDWILMCIQLFIAILFFSIGYINKIESRITKVSLLITAIVLIVMGVGLWGILGSAMDTEYEKGLSLWKSTIRICAVDDIIIAFIALYAFLKIPKPNKV